jgi:hypothetical protein
MKVSVVSYLSKTKIFVTGALYSPDDRINIVLAKRQQFNLLTTHQEYIFPCILTKENIRCEIDLNSVLPITDTNHNNIWDFFVSNCEDRLPLKLEDVDNTHFSSYCSEQYPIYSLQLYVASEGSLALRVKYTEFRATVAHVRQRRDQLQVSLLIQESLSQLIGVEFKLLLKKRVYENSFEYHKEQEFKLIQNTEKYNGLINIVELANLSTQREEHFEWFLKVEWKGNKFELPLVADNLNVCLDNWGPDILPYHTIELQQLSSNENQLSINICLNQTITNAAFVTHIDISDEEISIHGTVSNLVYSMEKWFDGAHKMYLKRRISINGYYQYFEEILIPSEIEGNLFRCTIRLEMIKNSNINLEGALWDLCISNIDREGNEVSVNLSPNPDGQYKKIIFFRIGSDTFKLYVNGVNQYTLCRHDPTVEERNYVKIAVLGSCFSRGAFKSIPYFNPNYSTTFQCVYTQFHSSLISLVSEPTELDEKLLGDLHSTMKTYIKVDFEKTFFSDINKAQPDYLIIDLYADAAREVIFFEDEKSITGSTMFRLTPLFRTLDNIKILSHQNNDIYFEVWRKSMDKFAKKIKSVIPEERIILSISKFNYKYVDQSGEIVEFEDGNRIRRDNHFWECLNRYFLSKLPNVKILDMRDTTYIGQWDHPEGKSESHYSSAYYKDYSNKLSGIVIQDLMRLRA